jgi:hypothetical protein
MSIWKKPVLTTFPREFCKTLWGCDQTGWPLILALSSITCCLTHMPIRRIFTFLDVKIFKKSWPLIFNLSPDFARRPRVKTRLRLKCKNSQLQIQRPKAFETQATKPGWLSTGSSVSLLLQKNPF